MSSPRVFVVEELDDEPKRPAIVFVFGGRRMGDEKKVAVWSGVGEQLTARCLVRGHWSGGGMSFK